MEPLTIFLLSALAAVVMFGIPFGILIGRASKKASSSAEPQPAANTTSATTDAEANSTTIVTKKKSWNKTWLWGVLVLGAVIVLGLLLIKQNGQLEDVEHTQFFSNGAYAAAVNMILDIVVIGGIIFLLVKVPEVRKTVKTIVMFGLVFVFIAFLLGPDNVLKTTRSAGAKLANTSSEANEETIAVQWEKVQDNKRYVLRSDQWLVFTRVEDKCIGITPPEAVRTKSMGENLFVISLEGNRIIHTRLYNIGEADAHGNICGI